MSSTPRIARALCAFGGLLALFAPAQALALDARVDASLDAQFYSIRSPYGDPSLLRRRYTSNLGLDLENIQGSWDPRKPTLAFRSRLRVDADFGQDARERDLTSSRGVPGLEQAPLEVLYAYLEGRGFFGGLLGFRLGRQYQIDALGYWSFDGALLQLRLPIALLLSGYAGFEQRTGLPMLASGRFSGDGVWRGNRDDLEAGQYPGYLEESKLAPAYGATLESAGLQHVHARISYRNVQNRSSVLVTPFLTPDAAPIRYGTPRISSERTAASLELDWPKLGVASAHGVYDLLVQRVSDAAASFDWFARTGVQVGLGVDYFYPTFDGDSIFNWFTHRGRTTAESRLNVVFTHEIDASVGTGLRWYDRGDANDLVDEQSALTRSESVLAHANGRYHDGLNNVTLDASAERAPGAHSVGADLGGRRLFRGGRYDGLAILSLYDFADDLRPTRSATSFTYVLGAGVRPGPGFGARSRIGVEWEHSVNRLVGQRFRLLLTMDFTVGQFGRSPVAAQGPGMR